MTIRKAAAADIDTLIRLRYDYLASEGDPTLESMWETIARQLGPYFTAGLANDRFIGMLAEEDGKVCSVAFLAIADKPAKPTFITGKTGTLLNVLTYPEHRKKGLAYQVISALMEEAKKLGVSFLDLEATEDGKPLYEKLGFSESDHYTAMTVTLST